MADYIYRKSIDNVRQRRQIQHVLHHAVKRARGPRAIAVAAQIQSEDVEILAQSLRHPVPIAGVIQAAVDQNQRRLAFAAPIPKLQLQAMRIEKMRDRLERSVGRQDSLMLPQTACLLDRKS